MDISKITLPNGNTYNIKDATLRAAFAKGIVAKAAVSFSTTVVDYSSTSKAVTINVNLSTNTESSTQLAADTNFSSATVKGTCSGASTQVLSGSGFALSQSYTFTGVGELTVTPSGTANYLGTAVTFNGSAGTVYAVLPSYIGYVDDVKNFSSALSTHFTKLVKHSLNGSYSVQNSYSAAAKMVIAVPKNGNVLAVNKIVQHGTLDAEQQFTKDTTTSTTYDFYICNTKHNPGTYVFVIS